MELFDKKYVYFMWDDKLEEKKGFVADHIDTLVNLVNLNSNICTISKTNHNSYPFVSDRMSLGFNFAQFAYYDPNYELKVAHLNGDAIEFYDEELKKWVEEKEPKWWDNVKYRVKQNDVKQNDKFCTNRQLAKWLAQGNGESMTGEFVSTYHIYEVGDLNDEVGNFLVRRWDDKDWHNPTLDYMGIKQDEVIL